MIRKTLKAGSATILTLEIDEANDSKSSEELKELQQLWQEYEYRHDLIWQRIFTFTTAVVLISIISYVQQDIVRLLGHWILLAPLLASVLAGFVSLVMWNELELFGKIKKAYRRQQNKFLDEDLKHDGRISVLGKILAKVRNLRKGGSPKGKCTQHDLDEESEFGLLVRIYLASLVLLSVINGFVVLLIWIPNVLAQPICVAIMPVAGLE